MKLPILAGAVAAALPLLAGCGQTMPEPMNPRTFDDMASQASACRRGAIDAQRTFVLCPADRATHGDVAMAMKQRVDPGLDIAALAAEYGIARQSVTGIEAATYSRIVEAIPEVRARGPVEPPVTVDGRSFRKVTLEAEGRTPRTLFVEG